MLRPSATPFALEYVSGKMARARRSFIIETASYFHPLLVMLDGLKERLTGRLEQEEPSAEFEAEIEQLDQRLRWAQQQDLPVELRVTLRVARAQLEAPERASQTNLELAQKISLTTRDGLREVAEMLIEARQQEQAGEVSSWTQQYESSTRELEGPEGSLATQLSMYARTIDRRGMSLPAPTEQDNSQVQAYTTEMLIERVRQQGPWSIQQYTEDMGRLNIDPDTREEIFTELLTTEALELSDRAILASQNDIGAIAGDVAREVRREQSRQVQESRQEGRAR